MNVVRLSAPNAAEEPVPSFQPPVQSNAHDVVDADVDVVLLCYCVS